MFIGKVSDLKRNSNDTLSLALELIEKFLAITLIIGVIIYSVIQIIEFAHADWHATDTFYELINEVLLVTIGLELARMLIVHSVLAILELLAFVVARKMLKPSLDVYELFIGILAFVILLGANRYFIFPIKDKMKKSD